MTDAPLTPYRRALRRLRQASSRSPLLDRVIGGHVVPAYGRAELWLAARRKRYGRGAYALTRKNTRSGYEQLYANDEAMAEYVSGERVALYASVAEECARLAPRSLVDVGCGGGHFLREVAERVGPACRLTGVDHARSGVERLSALVPHAEGVVADLYALDLGERTFDVVVCMEVLEHVPDPEGALAVLGRLRGDGGVVLVSVPDGEVDAFEGHESFWSATELEAFLRPLGTVTVNRVGGDLFARIDPPGSGPLP